jgi:hypothetical protein
MGDVILCVQTISNLQDMLFPEERLLSACISMTFTVNFVQMGKEESKS